MDMMKRERTPTGEAATELILSAFRANGLLLDAGDLLSAAEGLTSARWQVLGAIALSPGWWKQSIAAPGWSNSC